MGRLALDYIMEEPVGKVYMANRNHEKVVDLSKEFPKVIPVDYKERYEILQDVDVLITATSSPHVIIKYDEIKSRNRELYIMDMAIPRDVEPRVGEIPNIHLYNVDDLQSISRNNERLREELSKRAEDIIEKDIEDFKIWLSYINIHPVIKSLKDKCKIIEEDTLDYIYKKLI
jgi:Glutamyl-tRNA reductase